MKHEKFIEICKENVKLFENERTDIDEKIQIDDVFTVWSCKTLQNSKCLMSTPVKGAYYYEFTLDGDKREIYMVVYKQVVNIHLDKDGDILELNNHD